MLSEKQGSLVYVILMYCMNEDKISRVYACERGHLGLILFPDVLSAENYAAENIANPYQWEVIGIPQ